jgi:hypothetical protein
MAEMATAHVGEHLYGPSGNRIGKITDVMFDDRTLQPEWYVVRVGILKGNRLVPVGSVGVSDLGAAVPYDKERIRSAPQLEGPTPTETEREALSAHYGSRDR